MSGPAFNPTTGDGNPSPPLDLGGFPVLSITGNTRIQVDTLKACSSSNGQCIPDLAVELVNITYE